jgi:cobalt/nickel transport system ATP-binding protein
MGSRAKSLAEREKIALDFTYGVIDKCILRALIGEPSLILTSEGMVKRVERRVLAFDEESGISISVQSMEESES